METILLTIVGLILRNTYYQLVGYFTGYLINEIRNWSHSHYHVRAEFCKYLQILNFASRLDVSHPKVSNSKLYIKYHKNKGCYICCPFALPAIKKLSFSDNFINI